MSVICFLSLNQGSRGRLLVELSLYIFLPENTLDCLKEILRVSSVFLRTETVEGLSWIFTVPSFSYDSLIVALFYSIQSSTYFL